MSILLEQTEINGMTLANRFVRSATWEGMAAPDGAVTPKLTATMEDLAKGGVGLIVSGHAFISPEGQAGPWQLGIYKDGLVPGLRQMTAAVHAHGGRIVAQLAHAGNFAAKQLTGRPPLVVSNFEGLASSTRREVSAQDIGDLIHKFARAATRAKQAGFDGVQIHSAHGYFLSQFLSPAFNRRQDEYGGPIENRARVHFEVFKAVRGAVGEDFPVLIKLNCQDFSENGLELDDSIAVGRMLADVGLDAVELSGGVLFEPKSSPSRKGIKTEEKEAYFREEAAAFRAAVDIPLILVGGNRSFSVAEDLVTAGAADYVSLCRPFIREPGLINRWKQGDRSRALCKSDNLCFEPAIAGKGIYCLTAERERARE